MPCRPGMASMSLGRAWVHEMEPKLREASKAGFEGIEIFYEDMEYMAKAYGGTTDENLLKAARETRSLCDELGLFIICLQPFTNYGGILDQDEHRQKIEKMKFWFKLVKILKTDIIQIPSNFMVKGVTGDMDRLVQDMIEVADLGLEEVPPIRFAYENLCWGTYVDTWETLWDVVTRVDRPNFGCCLDTFNIAGRVWADPASASGKTPNADEDLKTSMDKLVKTIDLQKVWYVQVVDAERMESPLVEGHAFYDPEQPPRMSWSRNARLFLYEQDRGGYLPVVDVTRVLLKELKFEGWVSMELFSRTMAYPESSVPHEHAQRAISCWKKLKQELKL